MNGKQGQYPLLDGGCDLNLNIRNGRNEASDVKREESHSCGSVLRGHWRNALAKGTDHMLPGSDVDLNLAPVAEFSQLALETGGAWLSERGADRPRRRNEPPGAKKYRPHQ